MLISQAHAAAEATAEAAHHAVPFYQDTTFFVAVAFVLFFVVFGKKLFLTMASGLDERSKKIQD